MFRWVQPILLALLAWSAFAAPSGPVRWGDTIEITTGGWGRMVALTNGAWLCVSTVFPRGTNSYLALQRSDDACRTWRRIANVAEPARTLDNGELIALPDGSILLTMRSLVEGSSYRLPVYRTTNAGVSWNYLSTIDESENNGKRGLWEPDLWVLDNGQLAVTYSNEKHPQYSQVISEKISRDGGATWDSEIPAVAQPGGGALRPGMSQMARMANGQYILVYEIVGLGNADVYSKVSPDGITWPEGLGKRVPCHHCGPFITSVPDGRLFISSCENEVSFSEDFGETWQRIDPPAWPVGFKWTWPAVYAIKPNEIGVMAVLMRHVHLRLGELSPPIVWPNPFYENFSTAVDNNWTRYGGQSHITNGVYLVRNAGTNASYGKALTGDARWEDGVLEADVKLLSRGHAGLLFRATNPDYTGPNDVSGYYAGLNTDGTVFLARLDYSWELLGSAGFAVSTNKWHHLKITAQGDELKVHVDNSPKAQLAIRNTSFGRGQIGVKASGCDAQFDNITFTRPGQH